MLSNSIIVLLLEQQQKSSPSPRKITSAAAKPRVFTAFGKAAKKRIDKQVCYPV